MVGAERGGPAQGLGGAVEVSLGPQRLAEIDVGLGPLRVEFYRAPIGCERGVKTAGGLEHVAEVVVRAGVSGVEGDRSMQEGRRFIHSIEPEGDKCCGFQRLSVVGPGGQNRAVKLSCLPEPSGPRIERGAPHRLADARRRKPPALVAARSAIACRHPVTPPCAKRNGGDATMFDAALSRRPSDDTPPDRAGGATRSARAFGSASAAQSPRSATAGTRYRQGLRRHQSRPRPPLARPRNG